MSNININWADIVKVIGGTPQPEPKLSKKMLALREKMKKFVEEYPELLTHIPLNGFNEEIERLGFNSEQYGLYRLNPFLKTRTKPSYTLDFNAKTKCYFLGIETQDNIMEKAILSTSSIDPSIYHTEYNPAEYEYDLDKGLVLPKVI